MTPIRTIPFLLLAAALLLPGLCRAQDLPPCTNSLLTLAPGCSVNQAMNLGATEVSFLDCGATDPASVAAFYKDKLVANGFTISMENQYPGGNMLVAQLGDAAASIDIGTDNGATVVSLTLDGTDKLGTASGAAAPPAEGPVDQAAVQTDQALEASAAEEAPAGAEGAAKILEEGQGLAQRIWEHVTPPEGDVLVNEFTVDDNVGADMASTLAPGEILDYYRNQLSAKGWNLMAYHVEAEGGLLQMFKGSDNIQVFSDTADNGQGTEYMIMLANTQ